MKTCQDCKRPLRAGNQSVRRRCTTCVSARNRAKNLEIVRSAKDRPCHDCGGVFPHYVLQFDHRPGEDKLFVVSNGAGKTKTALRAEIAKCDVVCANCHCVRTHLRRQ